MVIYFLSPQGSRKEKSFVRGEEARGRSWEELEVGQKNNNRKRTIRDRIKKAHRGRFICP